MSKEIVKKVTLKIPLLNCLIRNKAIVKVAAYKLLYSDNKLLIIFFYLFITKTDKSNCSYKSLLQNLSHFETKENQRFTIIIFFYISYTWSGIGLFQKKCFPS